jgi:hypothetical protein
VLAVGEQLEDAPPDRVAEDVERVHATDRISDELYRRERI